AVKISVIPDIAVDKWPTSGAHDGSMGDDMAQLAKATGGPDAQWTAFVADIGVRSRSATQSAAITGATRSNAEGLQMSNASVDVDEEAVNMLTYQRAYEGAARVLTAIDAMLDTLINRTGLVGR
ncbi:MAG: flagellar hook-associated protein FlgK, partial [Cellulomonas sp.]|nr:flagellar hook-associated protein FlgK [Cellulomonas sp.]